MTMSAINEARETLARYDKTGATKDRHDCVGALRNLLAELDTVDPGNSPVTLRVPTSRPIGDDEIASLIFGTGALIYEWWGPVVEEERDDVDGYLFHHATEDSADDGSTPGRTWVSEQQIADAAGRFLGEGRGGEDARDMLTEDLGYADADAADTILQYAVLGKAVFG